MTPSASPGEPRPEPEDMDNGMPDGESGDCHWCAGEGWDECDDPMQCTNAHSVEGLCRCKSCGGSGLAKDMTIW